VEANSSLAKGIAITAVLLGSVLVVAGGLVVAFTILVGVIVAFQAVVGSLAAGMAFLVVQVVLLSAMVIIAAGLLAVLTSQHTSAAEAVRVAEERLRKLNSTQEVLTRSSEALSNSLKTQISLQKQLNTLLQEGKLEDGAKVQLLIEEQILKNLQIRLARTEALVQQAIELGTVNERMLEVVASIKAQLQEQFKVVEKTKKAIDEAAKNEMRVKILKEAELRIARQLTLQESIKALLFGEQQSLLQKTNEFAAKKAQILADQVRLQKELARAIKESLLNEGDTLILQKNTADEIDRITKDRLLLLEDERKKRVAMFTDSAREAAIAALKERRDTVLQFAKGVEEKKAIAKKFHEELDKLNKEFDEKERGTEQEATQPGAFKEGTVEAFRAAFGKNPLLDESKKHTGLLSDANNSLDTIKRELNKPSEAVGQMVIV
jgi:hypothetical protein